MLSYSMFFKLLQKAIPQNCWFLPLSWSSPCLHQGIVMTRTTTIKCSLQRLRPPPLLRTLIESYVRSIHPLSVRGAWLAQTHILRCLNEGENLPVLNQTFFNRCFTFNENTKCSSLHQTYQKYHAPLEKTTDIFRNLPVHQYLSRPLNSACRQYMSAVQNHIALNFFKRLLQFVKRKLHICGVVFDPNVPGSQYKCIKGVMDLLQGNGRHLLDDLINAYVSANGQPFITLLRPFLERWNERYGSLLPLRSTYDCARAWSQLVPWVYELRCDLDEDLRMHFPHEKGRIKGLYKTYSLFPQPSFAVKHLTLDTSTLVDLLAKLRSDGQEVDNDIDRARDIDGRKRFVDMIRKEFTENKIDNWKELFPGIQRFLSGQKRFTGCLRTDGVSVCILCETPSQDFSNGGRRSRKRKVTNSSTPLQDQASIPIQDVNNVVAIDPGRRDIITAQYFDKSQQPNKYMNISNATFNHWRGTQRLRNKQMRRQTCYGLENMKQAPSGKVIRIEEWRAYMESLHRWLDASLPYFQSKTTRRLRLETYKREYKALDRCCQQIVGCSSDNKRPVVAFGNNQSTTGFGYASAPCQSLKKRLQKYACVVDVDEYATSQYCCRCHQRLQNARFAGKKFTEFKVCPNCLNSVYKTLHIHRDINAAMNIGRIFFDLWTDNMRPTCFQRHLL